MIPIDPLLEGGKDPAEPLILPGRVDQQGAQDDLAPGVQRPLLFGGDGFDRAQQVLTSRTVGTPKRLVMPFAGFALTRAICLHAGTSPADDKKLSRSEGWTFAYRALVSGMPLTDHSSIAG